MTAAPVHVAGERLMLDPAGALHWPAQHLLAVSDLHLEKGTSFAPRGMLLPPWDTRVTLDRLALLLRRYRPRIVVALGDSFHDRAAALRLPQAERERLNAIAAAARLVWVQGNHDPDPPPGLGGEWTAALTLGPLVFRHAAADEAPFGGEISGHHHPKAEVPARGTSVTRACFVTDGRRVVMPAFGAYTGGMDVREPAIARLFPRGGRVFLLGRERLYSFAIGPQRRRA
ncbi:MAG: ligase-associated DNA damage response endonuclease PdeM [Proteobacteria bacterium]|nr:ligase-associated DNA damage response endonuclease PdeM [Pseudomonadota bacterium]